jgi:hypothetical protein
MHDLPDFDGIEVTRSAVRITKAGDGLSEALKVQPKALHYGDEVYYVLKGTVEQINHKGDPDDGLTRVHTVAASSITEVDPKLAEKLLNNAAEALARVKAEAADADQQRLLEEEQAAEAEGD